ncbi:MULTISPECIES: hypothetical protein [Streptomyces]|uniref:hypothetical protein n=1 Tax=Streptomyces TaxID=1883 RepID=UPI0004AA5CF2|nr:MULTISPECIES: hypothetical protein [Streptomyces]
MALSHDEWVMLEAAAAESSGWLTGDLPLQRRIAQHGTVRRLVGAKLCEFAGPEQLDALAASGARPAWAVRVTGLGQDLLRYRALRDRPAERPVTPVVDCVPDTTISVRAFDLPLLRAVCKDAEAGLLPGVDAGLLGTAIARARPVEGSSRHSVDVTEAELAVILRVFYLESLRGGGAAGYHHVLRSSPLTDALRPDPVCRPAATVVRARAALSIATAR